MKLFKKFWDKISNERFVSRVVTITCTLITLFMVTTFPLPKVGVWAMGIINGFVILTELDAEFDEGDSK